MNGMIAMRTIIYFLVTSLLSAIIGLILVLLIHPGNPETKAELGNGNTEARQVDIVDNFMDLGRNLFPDNMFKASFQTVITVKVFLVGPFVGHGGTERRSARFRRSRRFESFARFRGSRRFGRS